MLWRWARQCSRGGSGVAARAVVVLGARRGGVGLLARRHEHLFKGASVGRYGHRVSLSIYMNRFSGQFC